ncbi:cell division protein ZapE [Pseudomonas sp. zfem002]|uniref:cell division protein ZapE n=1 Tax=Pseudomonas sp. zfem002 TaxID=3078197 RepID=UPI00292A3354|nr:cell division protein ZapE [Pseudomonas sp. zfem002]MDU9392411.1 cell division protein ZapE [Pseudomonas sp. zfem002]
MSSDTPLALYQQAIGERGFVVDPAQETAVEALQACFDAVRSGRPAPGVYLWGPVGRGKTWLMDQFHRCLSIPARRQHFHHFMRWTHQRLFQLNGTADPLRALARSLADEIRVLCFDELFVNDIGDAIILGRLFQELFEAGVVVVATSNQPPRQLYADGFNRERFLPAIAAIEASMAVVPVHGEQDHRLHPGAGQQRYWLRQADQPCALAALFYTLSGDQPCSAADLAVGYRSVQVIRRSETVLWCDYSQLCEQPLAAMEFMALCERFEAILLSAVPALGAPRQPGRIARGTEDGIERVVAGDRELPQLSPKDNGVRRFIALVDECYDQRVALYLEAEVPLEALYTQGYLEFPFRRTLSRLREMQLQRFR